MQSFDFKKILPHFLIIVGFAVFSLLYCFPQLEGRKLNNGDAIQWKAMAKEGMDWHEKTGENVLWSNSMFGGMPTYTYYVPESNNFIGKCQNIVIDALGKPACFLFLAMVCFYIMMRVLHVNRWLSIAGSVAYALSAYNIEIIIAGHETKMLAIAYFPAVIAGLMLIYRSKWLAGIPTLGLSLALMISTAHYQVIYYAIIVVLFIVIGKLITAIQAGKVKSYIISSLIALITAIVAVGPSLEGILPTLEYNKETMRGGNSELTINQHDTGKKNGGLDKDYAFQWSNSIGETFCLLIPNLYGGSSDENLGPDSKLGDKLASLGVNDDAISQITERVPLYWGDQPFLGGPFYVGAVICFLFVLGILVVPGKNKWWIIAVSALAIMMSWGRHFPAFNYFLFDHLPLFNKFRTPSMILTIVELMFPLMGIWGLNNIVQKKLPMDEVWKKTKIAVIITAGLCIMLGVGGSAFFSFKSPITDAKLAEQYGKALGNQQVGFELIKALQADRAHIAMMSGLGSALFIVLAGLLIWAYTKSKINVNMMVMGIGLLIAVDLIMVDKKYLNDDNYIDAADAENVFQPRQVDLAIMKDPDPYYRVLDLSKNVYNDASQAYFHKCIGGYSPAKMERYQDLIDVHMNGKFNAQVLNMLNTKYIIYQNGQGPAVMQNPETCGNAWFVNEIKWTNTADEEILALNANTLGDTAMPANAFNPKQTAVMRAIFKKDIGNYIFGKDSTASIKLAKYGLNDITFTSNNSKDGIGVFSDIYYPYGWKAYVDGKETPIIKADYVLRAIKIPAGQHKIEFEFHPKSFYTGNTIALVSSLLLFLVCGGSIVQWVRSKKQQA